MLTDLPDGAVPLAVGTILVLGALALVLSPLLGDGGDALHKHRSAEPDNGSTLHTGDSAIATLREVEIDHETGKLSDGDYAELKERYTRAALEDMRVAQRAASIAAPGLLALALDVDPVEAAIARARANQKTCPDCGPRTEPDAVYCSHCGRYLPRQCPHCGVHVEMPAAAFCASCGNVLVNG